MENYTLGLALFDYLPVIAAGFGLYLVCKYCASIGQYSGAWIIIIPAIALTGGVFKASWKLLYAVQTIDYRWMSELLFFFLASSYLLMATLVVSSFRAASKGKSLKSTWWYSPMTMAAIVIASALYLKLSIDGKAWSILLLATLSIANLITLIFLIAHAFKRRVWIASGAFLCNLVLSYVLVGLARIPEQTAELQWIEEALNLANNSLMAVGAWFLVRQASKRVV